MNGLAWLVLSCLTYFGVTKNANDIPCFAGRTHIFRIFCILIWNSMPQLQIHSSKHRKRKWRSTTNSKPKEFFCELLHHLLLFFCITWCVDGLPSIILIGWKTVRDFDHHRVHFFSSFFFFRSRGSPVFCSFEPLFVSINFNWLIVSL